MTITESTTIADIAGTAPASVRVFQRYGIDFCCGGKRPLSAACSEKGIDFAEVATAIEAACTSGLVSEGRDWSLEPLAVLCDHIVTTYHEPLREELPRLQMMAAKVARVHGGKAPDLARLEAVVAELSADLQAHMRKEELVLFPAIRALEMGRDGLPMPLSAPIAVMEHEHDHAGDLLAELRGMTDAYRPPVWACETFKALYYGLSELETTMHVHVHLENNILFPRALRLAEARTTP